MSTRSSIAIVNPDSDEVMSVYCHFDGYPEGVGATLVKFHNTEAEARHIIELGDLSILAEKLDPNPDEIDQTSVTVAYGRDRGEDAERVKARDWECLDEWLSTAYDYYDAEFCYWWENGRWHCKQPFSGEPEIELY